MAGTKSSTTIRLRSPAQLRSTLKTAEVGKPADSLISGTRARRESTAGRRGRTSQRDLAPRGAGSRTAGWRRRFGSDFAYQRPRRPHALFHGVLEQHRGAETRVAGSGRGASWRTSHLSSGRDRLKDHPEIGTVTPDAADGSLRSAASERPAELLLSIETAARGTLLANVVLTTLQRQPRARISPQADETWSPFPTSAASSDWSGWMKPRRPRPPTELAERDA